ncbi:MAG: ATP:cob(I)alamin adenosyltransferase [Microgenomates group bacterium]
MLKDNHCYTYLKEKKLKKSERIFWLLGSLDELNAVLGIARVFVTSSHLKKKITLIQEEILTAGSQIVLDKDFTNFKEKTERLEKEIEQIKKPKLKKFIKPGKKKSEVFLHFARVICRRVEREFVKEENKKWQNLIDYLNRLSLLLFWWAVKEKE